MIERTVMIMKTYEEKKEELEALFSDMSDLNVREIASHGVRICIIYISNHSSKTAISRFVTSPIELALQNGNISRPMETIIESASVKKCEDRDDAADKILSGAAVVFTDINNDTYATAAMTRNEDGRSTSEPETENVIRGAHEGFTESGENNAMLIRRRLKSALLKKETYEIGSISKTEVAVMYLSDRVNTRALSLLRTRIKRISTDTVTGSGFIELMIQESKYSLYQTVGNSERPDKIAAKLNEGRIAVITDGSPVVLTVPYLFGEAFQVVEDYAKTPWYASFIRMLRYAAFFISITAPALFVSLMSFSTGYMPDKLIKIISSAREDISMSLFWEVFVVLITFEIVREVGLRMPKAVGAAVGIVGSVIIGDSAVEAGIISAPVLIVGSLSAVCTFIVPPYMNANVMTRFIILIFSGLFGLYGTVLSFMTFIILLARKSSFSVPYLAPFSPVDLSGLGDSLIVLPPKNDKKVPHSVSGTK